MLSEWDENKPRDCEKCLGITNMDNIRYCKKCGAKLVLIKILHSFAEDSGKRLFIHKYKCPYKRSVLDFGHTCGIVNFEYVEGSCKALFYEDGKYSGRFVGYFMEYL